MSEPSIFGKLYTFSKAAVQHIGAGLKTVSPDEQERRVLICSECPELNVEAFKCNKCGCFLKWKIALKANSCPMNKWGKEEDNGN